MTADAEAPSGEPSEDAPKAPANRDEDDIAVPADPVLRYVRPVLAALLTFGSLAWSADLYRAVGLILFPEQFMSGMLGIALALVYLHYPARRGTERTRVPFHDIVIAMLGLAAGGYVAVTYPELSERTQFLPEGDLFELINSGAFTFEKFWALVGNDIIIVSFILVVLCIEGLRRTVGYSLVIIVVICIVYGLVGHLVPGAMETQEVEVRYFVSYLALDTSALLGLAMVVGTTVVITFVFFGQLLMRSGGSQFFNDVSLTLMGRFRGGSAKISIIASSLFGSISGVAVSNIVATGVVTIPMMKRSGFSPRFAGAVEAVASTGGQLMPPVMGAVAFLMADFLQKDYQEIVIAALVPSLLYYVGLFIQADLEAAKFGIKRVPQNEIPGLIETFSTGWVFLLPFAALIWALFTLNWEPETAAMLAAGVVLLIALFLIMVGHVQQAKGREFRVDGGMLGLAFLLAAPALAALTLIFFWEVWGDFYVYLLAGVALLAAFFFAGLIRLAAGGSGGLGAAAGAVVAVAAWLPVALARGALVLLLLVPVWLLYQFDLVSFDAALWLSFVAALLAVVYGSHRLAAGAGRARQDALDGGEQQTSTVQISGAFASGSIGLFEVIRKSLIRTGLSSLDILMIVAGAGFIIGVLQRTGLGSALTTLLVSYGGGNLLLLLAIAAVLCIILGMGMPTAGVYILLAVLVAPSLVEVGVTPIAAHMFILYLGMMSLITPPVAVAAFFAANIARAPPMATGWTSVRFGWTAFVVPFLFVFSPSLLLQGEPMDLVIDVASAVVGVWLLSAAMIGYFLGPMAPASRLIFTIAGIALLAPRGIAPEIVWANIAGLALGVLAVAYEFLNRKSRDGPIPAIQR